MIARTTLGDCPSCGYKSAFSVTVKDGRELFHCHAGCSQDDLLAVIREGRPVTYRQPSKTHQRVSFEAMSYVKQLWESGRPINDTLAETYLISRGLADAPLSCFRFMSGHLHKPTGTRWPVMLAAAVNIHGRLQAIHRTYISRDGKSKAQVEPAKMTLGPVGGYAVHFTEAGKTLAISEGIETGLSILEATGMPVWAALSAGGIRKLILPPLPSAAEVIICADNDANGCGQNAARAAAMRWRDEGRRVRVALPPEVGKDFNDIQNKEKTMGLSNAYV